MSKIPFVTLAAVAAVVAAPAGATDGAQLFSQSCGLCHQPDGRGAPGVAPPLVNQSLWDGLGPNAVSYLVGVMLTGLSGNITNGGSVYAGLVMPPQDRMTDDELAAVGGYVLGTLNASQAKVSVNDVASLRSTPPTHAQLRTMRRKLP